jgi:hypothetical protein
VVLFVERMFAAAFEREWHWRGGWVLALVFVFEPIECVET